MGDNSLDWASILGAFSDSDELMSLIINDVKAEKPEDHQLQESSKFLLQPALLPHQNIHVIRDVEPGSSSCQTQDLQTRMITTGGCLMNPLGFPYRSQNHVAPAAAPSGSGIQSSQQLLILNDIPARKRGREIIQEATEEAEQRKKMNMIKNRISAAKSRAKKQEHTRFLEEKVEQLRNENAHLKKLLSWLMHRKEKRLKGKSKPMVRN
ncbi:hypothetical protein REPUB_Repub05bG0149100 [Reevesia pubescens]